MDVQWIIVHMLCWAFKWVLFFRCSKLGPHFKRVSGRDEPQASRFLYESSTADEGHRLSSLGWEWGWVSASPAPLLGQLSRLLGGTLEIIVPSRAGDTFSLYSPTWGPPLCGPWASPSCRHGTLQLLVCLLDRAWALERGDYLMLIFEPLGTGHGKFLFFFNFLFYAGV